MGPKDYVLELSYSDLPSVSHYNNTMMFEMATSSRNLGNVSLKNSTCEISLWTHTASFVRHTSLDYLVTFRRVIHHRQLSKSN